MIRLTKILLVLLLSSSCLSLAAPEWWGPSLETLVVARHRVLRDYSSQVFNYDMQQIEEIEMGDSCKAVTIQNEQVYCHSVTGESIPAGLVERALPTNGDWEALQVRWSRRVQLEEREGPKGRFIYTLFAE